LVVALSLITTSVQPQSANLEAVRAFFDKYVELCDTYDVEVANLYSDSAVIAAYRRYPHGVERSMEITGSQWKMLLDKTMSLSQAQADRSTYKNIRIIFDGSKATIRADRYSERKCYTDRGYYMIIERQPDGAFLIVEEYFETQPQSNCK
jgi:hypothetical protein